jgi:hypothetical protein
VFSLKIEEEQDRNGRLGKLTNKQTLFAKQFLEEYLID